MKYVKYVFFLAAIGFLVAGALVPGPNVDPLLRTIADQVVAAMPRDIHLRILAVGSFEGPEAPTFRRYLQSALEQKSDFVLVEREKIDRVFEEQKFQSLDVVDPRARVDLGNLLGAEGLLFGRVTRLDRSPFGRLEVAVHVTLDDIQRGEVCFDREFRADAAAPRRARLFLLALVCFLLGLFAIPLARLHAAWRMRRLARAEETREDAEAEIRRADRLLADLQTRAHRAGDDRVHRIREMRTILSDLGARARAAAGGAPGLETPRRERQLAGADRDATRSIRRVRERLEKIARGSDLPGEEALSSLLDELRAAEAAYAGRRLR